MEFFKAVWEEILNFFNITELVKVIQLSNYHSFLSFTGIITILRTALPVLLFVEIARNILYKKFKILDYNCK